MAEPARRGSPEPPAPPDLDDDWDDEDEWDEPHATSAGRSRDDRDRDRGRGAGSALGGDRRPKVGDTRRRGEPDAPPSWERPRRYEAYPTLKTRVGLPLPSLSSIPRLGVMVLALVVAAIALFFLPALLGVVPSGDDGNAGVGGSASPPAAVPSASVEPTTPPAPTPQLYVVQDGDTLSSIAQRFNLSLAELIEANRETLPNPDILAIGDQLIIPVPPPDEVPGGSANPSLVVP